MNKGELIKTIVEDTGLSTYDVESVVLALFHEIQYQMLIGEEVKIRGFGTFGSKWRKSKTGRDFTTKSNLSISSRYVPTIIFSENFKDMFLGE